ncbi:MAG: hybrid sensor histidine kinase/response regulator [Coleofasciculaceae cyanobacterium]
MIRTNTFELKMSPEILQKCNILIIDDNPTNLSILFEYLTNYGFKVFVALDGETAIEQIEYTQPDLILLDVMMPGIDGFETCRRLKAIPMIQEIPVIFLTALADTVDKVTGFKIGAVDYITKPIQHEEVLSRIQTHLTIRNLQKKLQEKNKELALLNYNLEALVEARTKQLIHQEKTAIIGRLTQGIIHNIKTPLQTIFLYRDIAEALSVEHSQKPFFSYIQKMAQAAQQINQLMDNLMYKSRLDQTIELVPIDINSLLRRELELLDANPFFKYYIEKHYLFDEDLPILFLVYADISLVFDNLINNAIDAMWNQEQQELTIITRQDNAHVYLDFKDTGCGISPENLSRIFEPFYTSKPPKSDEKTIGEPTGTGLGLYTCVEILKSFGGELIATSKIGQGSIFTIVLPKQPQ